MARGRRVHVGSTMKYGSPRYRSPLPGRGHNFASDNQQEPTDADGRHHHRGAVDRGHVEIGVGVLLIERQRTGGTTRTDQLANDGASDRIGRTNLEPREK